MPSASRRDARRRALGQNFLRDRGVIADVVDALAASPGELVVDLGAGDGALTAEAASRGIRVQAVEIDPGWLRVLRERNRGTPGVEVVGADALTVPLPHSPFAVVSSAPYNIGTRLVRRLLTDGHGLSRAVLVLQAETARRLAGRPSCGRFAATWAPWFELRVGREIPARAFRPVPRVNSAILSLSPRRRPLLSPAAYGAFDEFLASVFTGRGATVAERLARAAGGRKAARRIVAGCGLSRAATPGDLDPEDYARLYLATRRPRDSRRRGGEKRRQPPKVTPKRPQRPGTDSGSISRP